MPPVLTTQYKVNQGMIRRVCPVTVDVAEPRHLSRFPFERLLDSAAPTLYRAMFKPSPGYFSSATEMSLVGYMRSAYMPALRVPPIARAHHASELPQPSQVFHVLVASTVAVMEVGEEC